MKTYTYLIEVPKQIDAKDAVGAWAMGTFVGEVVRCKECKRANHELSGIYCGLSDVNMGEDGYCSIGEREGE